MGSYVIPYAQVIREWKILAGVQLLVLKAYWLAITENKMLSDSRNASLSTPGLKCELDVRLLAPSILPPHACPPNTTSDDSSCARQDCSEGKTMVDEESHADLECDCDQVCSGNRAYRNNHFPAWHSWAGQVRSFARSVSRRTSFGYTSLPTSDLPPNHEPSRTPSARGRRILGHALKGSFALVCLCAAGRYSHRTGLVAPEIDPQEPTSPAGVSTPIPDVASPLYHLFDTATLTQPDSITSGRPLRLRAPRHLPVANGCLDEWFTQGTVCSTDVGPQDRLDLIYLWVNGSDLIWQDQYELTRSADFPDPPMSLKRNAQELPVRHYRSQGTLKYAIRSAVEAFRRDESSWIRKVHVLTADMPIATDGEADPMIADYRLGQIPDWLNKERVFNVTSDSSLETNLSRHAPSERSQGPLRETISLEDPPLQWHFHSEVFRNPILPFRGGESAEDCATSESAEDWSSSVMPTFNSFAIETRMAWLDDLADFT